MNETPGELRRPPPCTQLPRGMKHLRLPLPFDLSNVSHFHTPLPHRSSNLDLTEELASVRTALLQLQHSAVRHTSLPLNAPPSASTHNNALGVAHQPHHTSPWAPPSARASTSSTNIWTPAAGPTPTAPPGLAPSPQPAYSHQFLSPPSSPSNSPRTLQIGAPSPLPPHRSTHGAAAAPSAFPGGSEDVPPPPGGFLGGYGAGSMLRGAPWPPPVAAAAQQQQQNGGAQGQGPAGAADAAAKAPYPPSFVEVSGRCLPLHLI